jgi:hypothetical protein
MTQIRCAGRTPGRWRALALVTGFTLVAALSTRAQPTRAQGPSPGVAINGTRLTGAQLHALQQRYRVRIPRGRYWYDRFSGAWGRWAGPTLGFTLAGVDVGGPLPVNASGGKTRVFVNGRELHRQDVAALRRIVRVRPGRYWLDAWGNGGYEGGPRLFNLVQLARAAGAGRGGPWSYHSRSTDAHVGGDGQGFLFYIDRDSSMTVGP